MIFDIAISVTPVMTPIVVFRSIILCLLLNKQRIVLFVMRANLDHMYIYFFLLPWLGLLVFLS
jgi:hypothetical protein